MSRLFFEKFSIPRIIAKLTIRNDRMRHLTLETKSKIGYDCLMAFVGKFRPDVTWPKDN